MLYFGYSCPVKTAMTLELSYLKICFVLCFTEKPDQPQDLVKKEAFIDKQNKPKIKVMWKPPRYDGGAAITHYHVEYKTVRKEWSSAEKDSVKNTEYTFQVDKSETYTFRTRAVNRLGIGKPAVITVNFTGWCERLLQTFCL